MATIDRNAFSLGFLTALTAKNVRTNAAVDKAIDAIIEGAQQAALSGAKEFKYELTTSKDIHEEVYEKLLAWLNETHIPYTPYEADPDHEPGHAVDTDEARDAHHQATYIVLDWH